MDIAEELAALEATIRAAQNEHTQLLGAKAGLSSRKSEIIAAAKDLGLEPKRELVIKEQERLEREIARDLRDLDKELKLLQAQQQ